MFKVKIHAAMFREEYNESFSFLKAKRAIEDFEYWGTTPLNYFLAKLNNNSRVFRKIRYAITGRDNIFDNERSWSDIVVSLFAPLLLFFSKDIIITGIPPYSTRVIYLLLLKKLGKKIIYSTSWPYWRDEKFVVKPNFLSKLLWRSFLFKIIAVTTTKKAAQELEKLGAIAYQIPHGVDTEIFRPRKVGDGGGQIRILYVGRLVEEKGIRGILRVSENFRNDVDEFIFVGVGVLEKLLEEKKNELPIKPLGLIKDREELARIYRNADILVSNSYATKGWEELFGLALVEAMSCGLPVIATDCVGPQEIIKNGITGYLIKQRDDKELTDKIRILIENPKLRKKMGKEARKMVIERYDVRKTSKDWLNVLEKVSAK